MQRRRLAVGLVLVLSLAVITFTTTPARATIARTYVASFGNDADPCTLAAPCATLTQALTQTSSAGEIIILDSGDKVSRAGIAASESSGVLPVSALAGFRQCSASESPGRLQQ